jgi:predicted ferric reductase
MPSLQRLAIPLLTTILVVGPVAWAMPRGLPLWRSLGIVLGWVGVGLLLASLLLMLREAKLAQALGGLERMYRWHHGVGFVAYLALLLHPLALAAEGWVESPRLAWQTLSPFSEGWAVWLGWAALLCLMIGLAASFSARFAYRTWRLLHGLLGLGVLAGLLHLALLGISATVLAATLLGLLLLAWRGLRIDLGLAARPYVVAEVEHVAASSVEIRLRPLAGAIVAAPGQFVMVACSEGPHFRGCREYHPFTVSAIAPSGEIRIGVKSLGDCTRVMQSIEPGVAARVQGPFGAFLAQRPAVAELWVAGGIGVTPFVAQLRAALPARPTAFIYLYRSAPDAAYLAELHALAAQCATLTFIPQATGDANPDLDALLPYRGTLVGRHCYLCGPPGLIAGADSALRARGVTPDHIHYESFDFR